MLVVGDSQVFGLGVADDMSPFMTTVAPVRDEARARLAAVTHEDGTARLQTVEAARAPHVPASRAASAPAPAPSCG